MAAHFIIAAAIACHLAVPILDKLGDNLPNQAQLALIPISIIDIGCAIITRTPFSLSLISEIVPHTLGALNAIHCSPYLPGHRGSVLSLCR